MLTAKDMPQDKHTGFIVGTDDYMTKPPDRQELVLRIKAAAPRRIVDEHKITIGDVELDYDTHPCGAATMRRCCRPRSSTSYTSCWLIRKDLYPAGAVG